MVVSSAEIDKEPIISFRAVMWLGVPAGFCFVCVARYIGHRSC